MRASVIDIPRLSLDPDIWESDHESISMVDDIREQIISVVDDFLEKAGISEALVSVYIYGSILTNQWNSKTDVDGRMLLDKEYMNQEFPGVTGKEIYEEFEDDLHDILLGDTNHPLNLSVVIEGEMEELGNTEFDAVYDVVDNKIINNPYFEDEMIPDEIFEDDKEEAKQFMEYLDELLLETKVDAVDYQILEEAVEHVKSSEKVVDLMQEKVEDIEDNIRTIVEEYEELKEKRGIALSEDPYDDWRKSRHWAPGNVQIKYLERYKYVDTLKKLKKIFEGGVQEEEIEDVVDVLT